MTFRVSHPFKQLFALDQTLVLISIRERSGGSQSTQDRSAANPVCSYAETRGSKDKVQVEALYFNNSKFREGGPINTIVEREQRKTVLNCVRPD